MKRADMFLCHANPVLLPWLLSVLELYNWVNEKTKL